MTAFASPAQPSAFSVFRNRAFTLLWTAQSVSAIGTVLTSIAATILVYRVTGSALSVGLILIVTTLPSILVGLVAGVFADRFDRKRIMIASNLICALLVLLIPLLLPFGFIWLYVLMLLSSAITQFYDPAHESVLPELASDEELVAANSMMAISSIGFTTIGFVAAGLIAARFPITWAFYLDALSFILSAVCISLVHVAPLTIEDDTSVGVVLRNLREGLRFLVNTPSLRSLLVIAASAFITFGLLNALFLPFTREALGASEFEYGVIEAIISAGFVIGSFLMARLGDRLHIGQWIVVSYTGMGLSYAVFALLTSMPFAIAVATFSGFIAAPAHVGQKLLIQRNTPREVRGRVNSVFFVASNITLVIGMAVAGLADLIDVRVVFFTSSLLLVGVAALATVLPGVGQPVVEWRRAIAMLRSAPSVPELGRGRAATLADIDLLTMRLPLLGRLSAADRKSLVREAWVYEAPAGMAIMRHGERSDAAYFILDGRAVVGRDENGSYRSLDVLNAGDFFGEISALTGVFRRANMVTHEPTIVLQVPTATLRQMMSDPQLHRLFLSHMTTRMVRMRQGSAACCHASSIGHIVASPSASYEVDNAPFQ